MQFGIGDCDDESVGYPIKLRIIRTRGAKDWDHIYLLVALPPRNPSRWIPLDASVDRPAGWQPSKRHVVAVRNFGVT